MKSSLVSSLARKAEQLCESLSRKPVIGPVLTGSATREEYLEFLIATYHYVRWSERLLAGAAEGLRQHEHYPSLVELLRRKSAEESTHDRWVLDDIQGCGEDPARATSSVPKLSIAAYVAWGSALSDAGSPAYLGAAYMLEGISLRCAGLAAARLCARGEIVNIENSVKFLDGHGDADVAHIQILERELVVVVDPAHQAEILASADVLACLYPRFFALGSLGGERHAVL